MAPPRTTTSRTRRLGALGTAVVALIAPIAVATPAYASSTANEVVYVADDDGDFVYSVNIRNLATGQVNVVLPARFEGTDQNPIIYDGPQLSPDGSRIAMSSDRGSATFEEGIVVVDRDGTNFRRVTNPTSTATRGVFDLAATWSPNGDTLLFTRITTDSTDSSAEDATVSTALFTVPASGGTPIAVPGGAGGYTADWNPDGDRIVFATLTGNEDQGPLSTMNLDGTGRTALGVSGFMPAWSPDGASIAYANVTTRDPDRASAEDATQIGIVPAAGGPGRNLTVTQPTPGTPTVAEYPAWMPDSQSLVFDLFAYGGATFPPGDLWAVDAAGTRAGRLAATPGDDAQAHVQGPAPTSVTSGSASKYVPVTPRRVLDTRPAPNNVGAPAAKIGPAGTVDLTVRGLQTAEGTVPADATAVVLNVTVTGTTAATDVRVYPSGTATVPTVSNLNAAAGQTVPNLVTATLGSNGAVTLRNSGGTVNLIADIAGYYVPAATAGSLGFSALDPGRILDTRNGLGARQAKLGARGELDLQVTGSLASTNGRTISVPADASAVVLNVTATGVTNATDVRVYPVTADGALPTVSNLNLSPGQTAPNLVTVAVGDGGKVRLRNANGNLDLIADIAGYYSAGASGQFVPVSPTRFLDTRTGTGAAPIPTTAAGFVDLGLAGFRGLPTGATAVVLNVTGTGVSTSTDVRAYPLAAGGAVPTVSNLNLGTSLTRANAVIVKTGDDGRVRIRNAAGQLNLIADVAGYMVG